MPDEHAHGGQPQAKETLIPGVKHVIAISSGKGGVGKSTVASNLACALALTGAKVGLMDADLYGPNIPMMMGSTAGPEQKDGKIVPVESYGVKLISMAFLVPEDAPLVWRGPMVHQYLQAFFRDVLWGDLDYLLLDLPPGTGDVQLSLSQMVPLAGAITVTTPQEVALYDVRKGMAMFQKVNVPLLGIIENMSHFVCGHCGERTDIFSTGGGDAPPTNWACPFSGAFPSIRPFGTAVIPDIRSSSRIRLLRKRPPSERSRTSSSRSWPEAGRERPRSKACSRRSSSHSRRTSHDIRPRRGRWGNSCGSWVQRM